MSADGFIPRRQREQTEREDKLLGGLWAALEIHEDLRDMIGALLHVVVLLLGLRIRDRQRADAAEKALDATMDALAAFDVRCAAGDVMGATAELRGWLGRIGA